MHQYLETVRDEIEAAAGQEAYLASTLFLRMHQSFQYEDDGKRRLISREEFEEIQHKAINAIHPREEFDLKEEILAWQAGMLRHVTKELYLWWAEYKDRKFRANDCFADGESCIALEATCEKLGINPTENYTAILEVEHVLTTLATAPNRLMLEIKRFWDFKHQYDAIGGLNAFIIKRIESESQHTTLYHAIQHLEQVSDRCLTNAKKLAGADHLLWMNPHIMLEAAILVLKGFVEFEYKQDLELTLLSWLNDLFPAKLANGTPNPLFESTLHHQVVARLTQGTQMLLQVTLRKNQVFMQRDEIFRPHLIQALEQVKRTSLKNISALNEQERAGEKL